MIIMKKRGIVGIYLSALLFLLLSACNGKQNDKEQGKFHGYFPELGGITA